MSNRDLDLEKHILSRIRKRKKGATEEIRNIGKDFGFHISSVLLPKESLFWWEPKWVLLVHYKEGHKVIYVLSGIIYRWRMARLREIKKYTHTKPAP
jgi:hypothetical protein